MPINLDRDLKHLIVLISNTEWKQNGAKKCKTELVFHYRLPHQPTFFHRVSENVEKVPLLIFFSKGSWYPFGTPLLIRRMELKSYKSLAGFWKKKKKKNRRNTLDIGKNVCTVCYHHRIHIYDLCADENIFQLRVG